MKLKPKANLVKLFSLSILIGLNTSTPFSLSATHVLGGDIQFECSGTSTYDVKHRVYRDCNGVALGATQNINYQSTACSVNSSLSLSRTSITEISPLCATEPSACSGGSGSIGIEMHLYEGVLNIPSGCADWIISYSLCCRSNSITNLSAPGSDAIYFAVTLNDTITPCNNSPTFNESPLFFGCVGDTLDYDLGAVDPDGDSLSFILVNCLEASNNTVEYDAGYSGAVPLTAPSTLTIDPISGIITIDAQVLDVSAVCVQIKEHRNGVVIGTTIRDFSVYIINCTNISPNLSGINGGSQDTIGVCTGGQTCIDIIAGDPNAPNQVVSRWNNAIAGATFTPGPGGNPDTSTFCWTPAIGDTGYHAFTVTTEDDGCPITLPNSRQYVIEVLPCIMSNIVSGLSVASEEAGNRITWNVLQNYYGGSFQLERTSGENAFAIIAERETMGGNGKTEVLDSRLECGKTYQYRVRYIAPDQSEQFSETVAAAAHSGHCRIHISVFPIPATQILNYEWDSEAEAEEIHVFDMMGKTILRKPAASSSNGTLDVASLRPGKYIMEIRFRDGYHSEKGFSVK